MALSLPYYYGHSGEQYAFFRIPKLLITDSRFDGVSSDAKLSSHGSATAKTTAMARQTSFGDITEAIAPPLLKISVNGQMMNTKSNKIAWCSRGKSAPRRKKKEVQHDE